MKILFTFEDQSQIERATYIVNWFVYQQHTVHVCFTGQVFPYMSVRMLVPIQTTIGDVTSYDMWIYSVKASASPDKTPFYDDLNRFDKTLHMISLDDTLEFFGYKVNQQILEKTKCIFGNVWYKDKSLYNVSDKSKFRLIPAYHESSNFQECASIVTIPYMKKIDAVSFVGNITGNVPAQDVRLNTIIQVLRKWKHKFFIKITGHCDDPINTFYYNEYFKDDKSLKCPRMEFGEYLRTINESKISLCPKGNSPHITYRMYESFRFGTLVFMNDLVDDIEFYNPPIPSKQYISYRSDCSGLIQKMEYYYNNPLEAERIAEEGRKYWDHFKYDRSGKLSVGLGNNLNEAFGI